MSWFISNPTSAEDSDTPQPGGRGSPRFDAGGLVAWPSARGACRLSCWVLVAKSTNVSKFSCVAPTDSS